MPSSPRAAVVPGLPEGVEVRRSARRRRTVTAYREAGRTVVLVPARMPAREIAGYVTELVARLEARERRGRRSDAELQARAARLSGRYLAGAAVPSSVRWVTNQRTRWGSCTPLDGSIRLSHRLAPMPAYVVDYVLLHELAHLIVPGHGPDFEALLVGYPDLARARAFLDGVAHAWAQGHGDDPDGDDPDGDDPDGDDPDGGSDVDAGVAPAPRAPAPRAPAPRAPAPRTPLPPSSTGSATLF